MSFQDLHLRYYLNPAVAFVRGKCPTTVPFPDMGMDQLSQEQKEVIFLFGKENNLKMHKFKRTMELPRVKKVLGILTGLQIQKLLDIGTGRGVFIWPFLERLIIREVTCVDILDYRVDDLLAVKNGGIDRLSAFEMSATDLDFEDNSFDTVTALEVLEHIPRHEVALAEICRVAKEFAVISVPSKEDENPEHLKVLDRAWFKSEFDKLGFHKIKFDNVLNHLIVVANLR